MNRMIKIEFDLPEFEKELNVSVTLKKDGEVIATSSSLEGVKTELPWKQKIEENCCQGREGCTRNRKENQSKKIWW